MKAFVINETILSHCLLSACADELGRKFNDYSDRLAAGNSAPPKPDDARKLWSNIEQQRACIARAVAFFGIDQQTLMAGPDAEVVIWAQQIMAAHGKSMHHFSFMPAGRHSADSVGCQHSADELFRDATAAANLFSGRRRVLSLVAPHSLLGFVVAILAPNIQGIETLDVRRLTPEALSQTLAFGDLLVATPSIWRFLIREGLTAPDNAMAVTFGEPMTSELAADMRKAGFGALRELYGSTETGLVAWRDSPADAFILFDQWSNDDGELYRHSVSGRPVKIEPMDNLTWETKRKFWLGGRCDSAVQIGAVNVFPQQVASKISAHPAVRACIVRVGQRSDMTNRLIAYIALEKKMRPDAGAARDIDAWCRANLVQQERPRIYKFFKELPQT